VELIEGPNGVRLKRTRVPPGRVRTALLAKISG
jgi:hypothetical protein